VPRLGGPPALHGTPGRIESGWWDGGGAVRDHFIAATPARQLVWVFRPRRSERCFLHGLFA
jgi:protein ImuB